MTRDEAWLLKEKYHGVSSQEFLDDCLRLTRGEPLAYVIGHIPFLDTTIFLDSKPLIPRSETEYWVRDLISSLYAQNVLSAASLQVLDLCAGSGCIGVSLLKSLPNTFVDFVEIEERHHATILKNVYENGVNEARTRVFNGDLFYNVSDTYQVITANPPYIDKNLGRTEESVLVYEPEKALFAEDGGFEILERIIREAPHYLTPHGLLILEHEPEHRERVQREADRQGLIPETHKDQYGVFRYSFLRKGV